MMKFLEEFGKTQNENLKYIREEISEIKNEIKTIKSTTKNFTQRFEQINSEIENIKYNHTATQNQIKNIESEITLIKDKQHIESSTDKSPVLCQENLILELKDRYDREKNIIIVGIPEINEKNSKLPGERSEVLHEVEVFTVNNDLCSERYEVNDPPRVII
ncbi:unnamed protein product [Parnassius apollo]|uniref:(apollo) hypothetical protein n=1 Tax=Parnassius apollo TaxID=110799 RepID=A0A8S3X174_PARAO|nr:unnamed protein product [Parnassius apollo]